MRSVTRGGFTLAELTVALALLAVIAASALKVLQANQQMYRHQVERMRANATLRAAAAILPAELRELDPADPLGGDLIRITPSTITYRSLRNLYIVCRPSSRGEASLTLFADHLGSRPLNPQVDSLLVFADGDPTTADDDRWLHTNPVSLRAARCPDGSAGVTVALEGVSRADMLSVSAGAPVRSGAVLEMVRYRDSRGAWWLGMRRLRKTGRRPAVQPLLGPLAPGGLEFSYFDAQGSVTAEPENVASIAVVVTAPLWRSRRDARPASATGLARIAMRVTLRNATSVEAKLTS